MCYMNTIIFNKFNKNQLLGLFCLFNTLRSWLTFFTLPILGVVYFFVWLLYQITINLVA